MKQAVTRTAAGNSAFLAEIMTTEGRSEKCRFGTLQAAVSVLLIFGTIALMRLFLVILHTGGQL